MTGLNVTVLNSRPPMRRSMRSFVRVVSCQTVAAGSGEKARELILRHLIQIKYDVAAPR